MLTSGFELVMGGAGLAPKVNAPGPEPTVKRDELVAGAKAGWLTAKIGAGTEPKESATAAEVCAVTLSAALVDGTPNCGAGAAGSGKLDEGGTTADMLGRLVPEAEAGASVESVI